jgi:hypothetical protein
MMMEGMQELIKINVDLVPLAHALSLFAILLNNISLRILKGVV